MTARILVVDDVAANLRLLEAKLRAEYFEVALASSGPDALAQAARWSPDVVLLDVMMPGMDGYEVCRRLKQQPATQHVPVVMITALTEQAERVRGLQAGADDFLSKPVDDATLFARLRALLRVKQVLDAWRLRAETARELGGVPPEQPSEDLRGATVLLLGVPREEAAALVEDGIELMSAADEQEAWQVALRGPCDLALLSLPLPGGDALRWASRLRAQIETRDLPLLLVADEQQRHVVLRAFDLGASDHVLRPVDGLELRARMRNQLRRRRYQDRLRADLDRSLELAVTDPLTGLRNRRFVRRHLDQLLRSGTPAAAVMIDVDRFKGLNDRYGHAAGDVALREVASRLRDNVRASDVVARFGGEEFLVVMAEAGPEDIAAVAERLRASVASAPLRIGSDLVALTISLGTAFGGPGVSVDALLSAADAALYRAKAAGRNRVQAADSGDWAGRLAPA